MKSIEFVSIRTLRIVTSLFDTGTWHNYESSGLCFFTQSLSLSHFLSLFLFVSALADAYRYLRKDEEIESGKSWWVRVGKSERAYWKYEKEKKDREKSEKGEIERVRISQLEKESVREGERTGHCYKERVRKTLRGRGKGERERESSYEVGVGQSEKK